MIDLNRLKLNDPNPLFTTNNRSVKGDCSLFEFQLLNCMNLLRILLPLLFLITGCSDPADPHRDALEMLDRIIEQKDVFGRMKQQRISKYLLRLNSTTNHREQINILENIYQEYYNYNIDSAYHYAYKMLTLAETYGDRPLINNARVYLARTLCDGGMYGEAERLLQQVDTTYRTQIDMFCYYGIRQTLMRNQLNVVADPMLRKVYSDSIQFYDQLCIRALPAGSILRTRLVANTCNGAGLPNKALDLLLPLYKAGIEDTHTRALVAFSLSNIYKRLGDADRRKEYLIRATADDLRTPVREGLALYNLSKLLLEEGDVERANRYINCSMEDALYCNYRSRMQQSSEMVQQIAGAYIDSLDAKRRAMGYVTIVVSLLVVVLLGSFFTILVYYRKIRQISAARLEMNRQLRELNEHIRSINGELRDANNIKDEYVGHYLSLCSQYILKINDYRKHLLKISKDIGLSEMLRELRSKNPADAEYKEFLAIFDETFLHLFPDFVAHVNRLMTDTERFSPRQPRTLNTELRILALIRLGVTHSAKIAAILNCSVATIHTYRAQLRNAAIGDRNAFDDAIRRIDISGVELSDKT